MEDVLMDLSVINGKCLLSLTLKKHPKDSPLTLNVPKTYVSIIVENFDFDSFLHFAWRKNLHLDTIDWNGL